MIELRDVILHVLRLAGPRGVNRTMLVKLVYFSELEHWRRWGAPLTDTPFRAYHYGAWAPEVVYVAEDESKAIEHSHFQGWLHWEHNYKLKPHVEPDPLPNPVDDLLAEVVARYVQSTAQEVGALSKETEPMRKAVPGRRLEMSVAAPRRPGLTVRNNRLARAQASLDLDQRGTRTELDERDATELAAWARARRRAARG
jgi:uncharacterized phage-associated protein